MTSEQFPAGPPAQVRIAGCSVGVQGVAGIGFAVVLAVHAVHADIGAGAVVGEAGYFALIGAGLVGVGWGLVTGRRWARTPAIVAQLLGLPVVYSLIGPSHQLLIGVLSGAVVLSTFLLLIGERSRAWSMSPYERDSQR